MAKNWWLFFHPVLYWALRMIIFLFIDYIVFFILLIKLINYINNHDAKSISIVVERSIDFHFCIFGWKESFWLIPNIWQESKVLVGKFCKFCVRSHKKLVPFM